MVKRLRKKFVIVTMLLMITVFGILYFLNECYSDYWYSMDVLQILEWLADYRVLEQKTPDTSRYQKVDGNPVCFVLLDQDWKIISQVDSTGSKTFHVPEELIRKVRKGSVKKWKWKRYIYTYRTYRKGETGIYYIYNAEQGYYVGHWAGKAFIVLMGCFLLFGVSIYLSKYVVEPARNALEREKQFIADASHELKTPVTAISINAQNLREEYPENRHLNHIISEAGRMDRLIHKLLTLSYLEGREEKTERKEFSLSECCEEIALTMESIAFEKKIFYKYQVKSGITYWGNQDEIRQVVVILLDNAIKHTPEMGRIKFTLAMQRNRPVIQVFNTGEGINPADIPHMFERFYCTEKSRNETDSFGLGLAIAKSIVENHGGKIKVKSQYGENACFYVEL